MYILTYKDHHDGEIRSREIEFIEGPVYCSYFRKKNSQGGVSYGTAFKVKFTEEDDLHALQLENFICLKKPS